VVRASVGTRPPASASTVAVLVPSELVTVTCTVPLPAAAVIEVAESAVGERPCVGLQAILSDEANCHLVRRGIAQSATRLRSISFEETRCTSHAKPVFSIVQMSHQVGSNCHGCKPCLADLGKA